MSDLLRDTLTERADSTEPPELDLDGVVSAGDRRIRRRRRIAVAGAAVAAMIVIAGGITAVRMNEPVPVAVAFTERRATYAIGSEIHYGKDVVSVAPYKVTAFVQTDAGFVFVSDTYGVFVADGHGVRRIGADEKTSQLTADDRGSLVGWVEMHNDRSESVVYDVAAGRELVRSSIGNIHGPGSIAISPRIVAIDGDYAYFGTLGGLYRWDVKANKGKLIAEVPPNAVRDVSSGQLVYQRPLIQPNTGLGLTVGTSLSDSGSTTFNGQQAFLSPGAKYLVTAPDDARMSIEPSWAGLQLFEVATGRQVGLPYAYSTLLFGQWLDGNTFTAAGERRSARPAEADLLTCFSESGTCKVAVPAFSTFAFSETPPRTTPFALPTGRPIYDLFN